MKAVRRGHPDLLPSLLQDEATLSVCLPADVGTDFESIKRAATCRFAVLFADVVDHPVDKKRSSGAADEQRQFTHASESD